MTLANRQPGILLPRRTIGSYGAGLRSGSSPEQNVRSNLTMHFPLDEASGNRVDAKAGKILVENGTVSQTADPVLGNAALFPGTNGNFLQLAYDATVLSLTTTQFSAAFWYRPKQTGSYGGSFNIYQDVPLEIVFGFYTWVDGTLYESMYGVAGAYLPPAGYPYVVDTLYHIVIGRESSGLAILYINGGLVATLQVDKDYTSTEAPLNLGALTDTGTFPDNCVMGGVSWFRNYCLDSADVAWLFNGGVPRTTAEIVGA